MIYNWKIEKLRHQNMYCTRGSHSRQPSTSCSWSPRPRMSFFLLPKSMTTLNC
ncbi:hypothetical protein BRADI_3g44947v3 [Brachypodium distachyon]|uniref:Uncharacterized protein n=1 Tax=Brachypodium distachyon TaxID=15368 RepID=A0A2K2D3A8_BRADI|nr:hypothetical protein BRADI_3g44947v3 [Brachypodium distachyon]